MAYEGEVLNQCGVLQADLSAVSVVAVSGDGPNVCGHLLLHSPSGGGYYFHVTGDPAASGLGRMRGYPMYMTESGYRQYLKETGKRELRRRPLNLPNSAGAAEYLERLLSEKWTWAILPHNCVAFVEDVIEAGGGDWNSSSNCPVLATTESVNERIQRFYQWMNSEIYGLYGVPR